jgi:nicotinamidase-related amidase
MTVTTLDPHSALILIDLQKGIVAYPMAHPIAGVLQQAVALADAFRRRGLPVVLVNVTGRPPGRTDQPPPGAAPAADWADLIPELRQQADDHLVTKRTSGAFTGTDLEAWLKQRGVTQVVIAGVATSNGVESTARHAYELGFNVTLAIDAMTDMSGAAHDNSLAHSFPRLGESGTSAAILALLPALPPAH